jgi:putative ATPase
LLSRSRVLVLDPLSPDHIKHVITQALSDKERGLGSLDITIDDNALEFLARMSNGDARIALNALELAANLQVNRSARQPSSHLYSSDYKIQAYNTPKLGGMGDEFGNQKRRGITIQLSDIKSTLQKEHLVYDTAGDEHYHTISAFIKSMRASDVDAALYYLARMVAAGEDPKFIARRMVIFASEDIGMAQPTALVVANEVFKTCGTIGYPECQINLAHGTVYLATQKKDRSAYDAYFKALDDVKKHGNLPIPLEIRNAPTKLMKELGYGKGYEMYPEGQSRLPEQLKDRHYWTN